MPLSADKPHRLHGGGTTGRKTRSGREAPCRRVAAAHLRAGFLRAASNERPKGEQMNDKHESRNKITIIIDGQPYSTRDDDQEAAALLRLAGKDPDEFDLPNSRRTASKRL